MGKIPSLRDMMKKEAPRKIKEGETGSSASEYYLDLPKGVKNYSPKAEEHTANLWMIPYEITQDNRMDSLTPGQYSFYRKILVHRNVGAGQAKRTVICPTCVNKRCPICDWFAENRNNDQYDWNEVLKHLQPSERHLFNVCVQEDEPGKVKVYDASDYCFSKLLFKMIALDDEDVAVGLADVEDGSVTKVSFVPKSGPNATYAFADVIQFKRRKEDIPDRILEQAVDLDSILKVLGYNELMTLWQSGFLPDDGNKYVAEEHEEPEPEEDESNPELDSVPDEPEPEPEPEKEKAPYKKSSDSDCPFGHEFGTDNDKKADCKKCEVWEDCYAASKKRKLRRG